MADKDHRQRSGVARFKPGVMPQVHLLLAALMWTGIGIFLFMRGIILLKTGPGLWLIGAGIVLGTIKSYLVLDRSARKIVSRIGRFADNTCIGAVYSWKTWLLVLAMAVSGVVIRLLAIDPRLVGTVCTAIGWGLTFSSRHAWLAWRQRHKGVS